MSQQPEKKKSKLLHATTFHVLAAALVLSLSGIVMTFCISWAQNQEHIEAEAETDIFKTFELQTLDGKPFTAQDLRSSSLVAVNVWGTDCPPCIQELPALEELNNSYDDSVFRIIGTPIDVSVHGETIVEERLEEAKRILDATGVTFLNFVPDAKASAFFTSTMLGTPTTYFLDSEGNILKTVTGNRTFGTWSEIVKSLLEEEKQK